MTPQARAEEIKGIVYDLALAFCHEQHQYCPESERAIKDIMAQIEEAVRVAVEHEAHEGCRDFMELHRTSVALNDVTRRKAKAEAYIDAAKIAESYYDWQNPSSQASACDQVAEQIRARAAEVCK